MYLYQRDASCFNFVALELVCKWSPCGATSLVQVKSMDTVVQVEISNNSSHKEMPCALQLISYLNE